MEIIFITLVFFAFFCSYQNWKLEIMQEEMGELQKEKSQLEKELLQINNKARLLIAALDKLEDSNIHDSEINNHKDKLKLDITSSVPRGGTFLGG